MPSENRLWEVYSALSALGKANSKRIAEVLGVSERTVQRYLRILVDAGYVEPVRHGMRLYYRVVRPLTEEEARRLSKPDSRQGEAPVYRLARTIDDIIREARLRADLVGAAKIHLAVPIHNRITHDIDVVVAREHKAMLLTMLKYTTGLLLEKSGGPHADYRFKHPVEDIKIDVMVDGFREEGRLVWNLAPALRRGRLTLEHAVIAKLTRRSFEYRSDGYDVAVALTHIDPNRFVGIYEELKQANPTLAQRVERHLEIVRRYILSEYTGVEARVMLGVLRRIEERLGIDSEANILKA